MVFSSLVFLWLFLPIVLILYYVAKPVYRNVLLLVASLFFYAWGEPIYLSVMVISILINYVCGQLVAPVGKDKNKTALVIGVIINLSFLGVFKYTGFVIENINALFGADIAVKPLALPIGISFYTFQSISYLVDIYRGVCKPQKNIIKMGLFISFFPQLIAGPILKYYDIAAQIDNRTVSWAKFNEGAVRFLIGLGKKVIIANTLAVTADEVFGLNMADMSTPDAWIGLIAYYFQIYFDFSGYSDMAIGLGKMFGFQINENFNHPYISDSIQDLWRRWHISLATWFKEYVYIPLGGSRGGTLKTYRNLMIVFFLTGLWHGASWNFVLWGVWNGVFIILEKIIPIKKMLRWLPLQICYVTVVFWAGLVLFRTETLTHAGQFFTRLVDGYRIDVPTTLLSKEYVIMVVIGFLCCGMGELLFKQLPLKTVWRETLVKYGTPAFCWVAAYFSLLMLASNTYNPFIYFRF